MNLHISHSKRSTGEAERVNIFVSEVAAVLGHLKITNTLNKTHTHTHTHTRTKELFIFVVHTHVKAKPGVGITS